jgi:ferric-dicitrate binding protein FerR (iron transport regulator)
MARLFTLSSAKMQRYFIKWKDGRLSASEQRRLQEWLAASPENTQEWARLAEVWNLASPPAEPRRTSTEMQWERLAPQLLSPPAELARAKSSIWTWLAENLFALGKPAPRWAWAGVALLLIWALVEFSLRRVDDDWQTLSVPHGQRTAVSLSDGSIVQLNAGSTFKYAKSFRSNIRQVELAGEAFFQVQPGNAPFKVETEHAVVQALRTEFNVRTWEQATRVFVQSGKVALQSKSPAPPSTLVISGGQMALCDQAPILLPVENPDDVLAWRQDRLVFRHRPLAEALHELERHFNVHLEADSSLWRHEITASFSHEPLSQVVEALAASLNAEYEQNRQGYRLRPK